MAKQKKFPRESFVSMTELVLPNDTNTLNSLMGGRLMHWMDIVSAISAQKHSNSSVVTASVDNISFKHPIRLGNVVTLKANVTRAFNTSMEVRIVKPRIKKNSKNGRCFSVKVSSFIAVPVPVKYVYFFRRKDAYTEGKRCIFGGSNQ